MGLREVVKFGDETLTLKCRDVVSFDRKLGSLLDDMAETMYKENGVGLAAPQVGMLRRAFVIDTDIDDDGEDNRDGTGIIEFVNPILVKQVGEQREVEGCLSSNGLWGFVTRPEFIVLEYKDRFGNPQRLEAEGVLAAAIAHEFDHLNGVLFTDLADEMVDEPPEKFKKRAARRIPRSRRQYEKYARTNGEKLLP
ncbi:MAG: peptide deformylase [Oscillospiraceae bacterium]|nr:peptide deformylase [Oscillospiraceae bacterium]